MSEPKIIPYGLIVSIQNCPKYRGALNGHQARVINGDYGDVRIKVDDLHNSNADSGHYYVQRSHLFVEMADGTTIELSRWLRNAADNIPKTAQYACAHNNKQTERKIIMMGNYKVALATYVDNTDEAIKVAEMYSGTEMLKGKHTSYEFACFDYNFVQGDTVLVKSGHHGYGVAVITGFRDKLPNDDQGIIREVLCRVDVGTHKTRLEMRRKAAELKEQMEQRAAELQDVLLYETLAASDSKMMELLTQFKNLT